MEQYYFAVAQFKSKAFSTFSNIIPPVEIFSDRAEKSWIGSATLVSGRQVLIV
jgi:hypothetical protein